MTAKARALPFVLLLLPIDVVVALVLLSAQIVMGIKRGLKPAEPVVAGFSPRSSTIIILNWDGRHLLEESLPAVVEAVRCNGGPHEVMVVDNGSTDGSADFVRTQ